MIFPAAKADTFNIVHGENQDFWLIRFVWRYWTYQAVGSPEFLSNNND